MFDPEGLSQLKLQPAEVNLEALKSCFLELCVQLGEIGDNSSSNYFNGYISWLKKSMDKGINTDSELMKTFADCKDLWDMHHETIAGIQQDVKTLLASSKPQGATEPVEYNQFVESDFNQALRSKQLYSSHRCEDCGSTKTSPRSLISHSASVESLIQLFTFLLPDLQNFKLLDIGSGLGSVLYGAYYFSKASVIYGVELNANLCDILNSVITKHKLDDRLKIVNADLLTQAELFKTVDVVVFNNVLEYFAPIEVQKQIWCFLKETIKPGTILVTSPDLNTLLRPIGLEDSVSAWVTPLQPAVDKNLTAGFPETDELFCVYRIIQPESLL